jgi:hypothetical protein
MGMTDKQWRGQIRTLRSFVLKAKSKREIIDVLDDLLDELPVEKLRDEDDTEFSDDED